MKKLSRAATVKLVSAPFWKGIFLLIVLLCFIFLSFSFNNYVSLRYIQLSLGNRVAIFFGKMLPTLLAICSFYGWSIIFFPFSVGGFVWS